VQCIHTYLQDDILVKLDKASMACSLEGRVPFLDHRLVEFSQTINPEQKLFGIKTKYLLKNALKGHIPDEIIEREKKGFSLPLADWLRKELNEMMRSLLLNESMKNRKFFNVEYIKELIAQHESCKYDHSKKLWGLMCLEQWFRQYEDNEKTIQEIPNNKLERPKHKGSC